MLVIGSGLGFYYQFQKGVSWDAPGTPASVSARPDRVASVVQSNQKNQARALAKKRAAPPLAVQPPAAIRVESESMSGGFESEVSNGSPAVIDRRDTLAQQVEDAYRDAVNLYQQGRLEESTGQFEIILSWVAEHYAARESLALVLVELGDLEAASSLLDEGLAMDPAHLPFAMLRARLSVEVGAVHEAIEILEAVSLDRFDVDHAAFLAALLQRRNEHSRSIALYSQVLEDEPHHAIWWMGLGISLEASRRFEDALKVYQTARAVGTLTGEPRTFVSRRIRALESQFR
jgi:MSHA biogenesis protein MshN